MKEDKQPFLVPWDGAYSRAAWLLGCPEEGLDRYASKWPGRKERGEAAAWRDRRDKADVQRGAANLAEELRARSVARAMRESARRLCEHDFRRSFCTVEGCEHWGGREASSNGNDWRFQRWWRGRGSPTRAFHRAVVAKDTVSCTTKSPKFPPILGQTPPSESVSCGRCGRGGRI
jgi:hypothetical protein